MNSIEYCARTIGIGALQRAFVSMGAIPLPDLLHCSLPPVTAGDWNGLAVANRQALVRSSEQQSFIVNGMTGRSQPEAAITSKFSNDCTAAAAAFTQKKERYM
ncbi:hypothetical protein [Pantoea sp. 18069]|uniref:hypothetical protein n=1 Tax=Pantoea sp. 18069 TaxID=2681415 RepID=UPI00135B6E0B|nr:hypothetical protein [Pantoea sp. 18069]